MGKLCLCTSLAQKTFILKIVCKHLGKQKDNNKVCSCTSSFKTGIYNHFKINSMGSFYEALRSGRYCLNQFQTQGLAFTRFKKMSLNKMEQTRSLWILGILNQVGTVFRLPDGSNISVISFIPFHPQYHCVSVDMLSIGTIRIIYHNNRM